VKSYIESYESLLNENDKRRLEGLLNVGPKAITSATDSKAESGLEAKIKELVAELGKGKMIMQLRLQEEGGQTDSESCNLNVQEAIIDLRTLYGESNRIDTLLTNHQQLNKAIISNMQKDIKRLENRIDTLNLLADNVQGYGTASRENFSDESMIETDRQAYAQAFVDRDGKILTENLECEIDQIEGTLKLGSSESYDRIHTVDGTTIATIEILEQTGEGFSDNDPNYGISMAIDGRNDTFWGEVLLSNGVLKVPMDGIANGAMCKFKITFPTPVTVSRFSFKPYCEYPIEICYVAYTKNDSNSIEPGDYCVAYDADNPILTDKGISLDFPVVTAKALIVLIRQSSATKNHYYVSVDQKDNKEMWSKIAAAEKKLTFETPWVDDDPVTINPSLSQDMLDQFDVRWQQYINTSKNHKPNFLSAVLASPTISLLSGLTKSKKPETPDRVQVERYEYVYGAYEIQVRGQEYNQSGVYVSVPHSVNGNIQTVVLESKEWHPIFLDADGILNKKTWNSIGGIIDYAEPLRRTSVEYSVSCDDFEPWIPILPLDQIYINNELLLFPDRTVPKTQTRFPIIKTPGDQFPRVYKDEVPLMYHRDWAFDEGQDQSIVIMPAWWDPESYYTIDYYPDESTQSAHMIDFAPGSNVSSTKLVQEYFNGAGEPIIDKNCSAKLKYYPYVDRDGLAIRNTDGTLTQEYDYNPIQITLNPSEHELNSQIHKINGSGKVITGEIKSTRNPTTDVPSPKPEARCLNVTDYFSSDLPVLNEYIPTIDVGNPIPTFEYYHTGKRVYFPETFRNDGAVENYGTVNGNAIVKIVYEYLVSGVRCRIVLRRTNRTDASVTPKIDYYALKFKVLI
jgi:hypothetical protein